MSILKEFSRLVKEVIYNTPEDVEKFLRPEVVEYDSKGFEIVDLSTESKLKVNWPRMAGETNVEKQINAYLSSRFVTIPAPADECLTEAREVIRIVTSYIYDVNALNLGTIFDAKENIPE